MLGQLSVLPANLRACAHGARPAPSHGCASRYLLSPAHTATLVPLLLVLLSHHLASAQQPSSQPAAPLPGGPSVNGSVGTGGSSAPLAPQPPAPPPPNLTRDVTDSMGLVAALREFAAMGLNPFAPVRINLAAGTFLLTDPDPPEITFNLNLVGSGSAELTISSSGSSSSSSSIGGSTGGSTAGGGGAGAGSGLSSGGTVIDCGGVDREAFIFTGAPFAVQDVTITRCGGRAPLYVNITGFAFGLVELRGQVRRTAFVRNTGTMAGAVAVPDEAYLGLTISGCLFRNNTGRSRPGQEDYVYDYDYQNGPTRRPALPASALRLGRVSNIVQDCVFLDNSLGPVIPETLWEPKTVSAPLEVACGPGPSTAQITNCTFRNNAGEQSGAIYAHGLQDGDLANGDPSTVGCSVRLSNSTLEGNMGTHAGAVYMSCPVRTSSCTVALEDSSVSYNAAPHSGTVLLYGSGVQLNMTNVTVAHNFGGGVGSTESAIIMENCRLHNNSGLSYGGFSSWGAGVKARGCSFTANAPMRRASPTAAANAIFNAYGNEFTDCVFESNWLHALFISAADLQAHGCAFRRNAVLQGSVDARGGALMLLDSVEGSAVSNCTFEGNVAVAGGAVQLFGSNEIHFTNCTFAGNRALSGGAVDAEVPAQPLSVANCTFLQNTAEPLGSSLNATLPPLAPGDVRVWPWAYARLQNDTNALNEPGLYDYYDSPGGGDGGGGDGGVVNGSSTVVSLAAVAAPPESCGNGGGGALCVRGAQNVQVSVSACTFAGNTALVGGGMFVSSGSRCRESAGCYRLVVDAGTTFRDNHATVAGGAIYWLYEQLLVVRCPAASGPAPQLAPPAWDGLMCALRTHTFVSRDTSLRLAVETTLNLTSLGDELKGESTTSPPSRAASPPRSASPPPPLPPSNGTAPAPAVNGNGGGGAATRPLLQLGQSPVAAVRSYAARALPCADWSNNTVHSGGYGPTIASSVFYHQPVLGVRQDDLIANMPSPPPPPLPPLPAAWAPPPAAPRSAVLAAVAAAAVKPPTAQQKGTKISGSVNAPAPAVAPPPSPRLQRHFLRGSSVRTDRGSGMSAGADGADGGGGRRALLQQEEEQSLAPPPPLPPPYDCRTVGGGAAVPPAPPSPPQWFESGEPLPIMVHIFDWYGQKVTRSVVDANVLVLCVSNNSLGQTAAETANGTADFQQLRLRDKVNATYLVRFTARTTLRLLDAVGLAVSLRPCRINEELASTGDSCARCTEAFLSLDQAACAACPEGALCSTAEGGVVLPDDGYWHSAPLSTNVIECPNSDACTYPGRSALLGRAQALMFPEGGPAPGAPSADAYRAMQCAPGYGGNLCNACARGYGRSLGSACQPCRGTAATIGWYVLTFGITLVTIAITIRAALTAPRMRFEQEAANAEAGRADVRQAYGMRRVRALNRRNADALVWGWQATGNDIRVREDSIGTGLAPGSGSGAGGSGLVSGGEGSGSDGVSAGGATLGRGRGLSRLPVLLDVQHGEKEGEDSGEETEAGAGEVGEQLEGRGEREGEGSVLGGGQEAGAGTAGQQQVPVGRLRKASGAYGSTPSLVTQSVRSVGSDAGGGSVGGGDRARQDLTGSASVAVLASAAAAATRSVDGRGGGGGARPLPAPPPSKISFATLLMSVRETTMQTAEAMAQSSTRVSGTGPVAAAAAPGAAAASGRFDLASGRHSTGGTGGRTGGGGGGGGDVSVGKASHPPSPFLGSSPSGWLGLVLGGGSAAGKGEEARAAAEAREVASMVEALQHSPDAMKAPSVPRSSLKPPRATEQAQSTPPPPPPSPPPPSVPHSGQQLQQTTGQVRQAPLPPPHHYQQQQQQQQDTGHRMPRLQRPERRQPDEGRESGLGEDGVLVLHGCTSATPDALDALPPCVAALPVERQQQQQQQQQQDPQPHSIPDPQPSLDTAPSFLTMPLPPTSSAHQHPLPTRHPAAQFAPSQNAPADTTSADADRVITAGHEGDKGGSDAHLTPPAATPPGVGFLATHTSPRGPHSSAPPGLGVGSQQTAVQGRNPHNPHTQLHEHHETHAQHSSAGHATSSAPSSRHASVETANRHDPNGRTSNGTTAPTAAMAHSRSAHATPSTIATASYGNGWPAVPYSTRGGGRKRGLGWGWGRGPGGDGVHPAADGHNLQQVEEKASLEQRVGASTPPGQEEGEDDGQQGVYELYGGQLPPSGTMPTNSTLRRRIVSAAAAVFARRSTASFGNVTGAYPGGKEDGGGGGGGADSGGGRGGGGEEKGQGGRGRGRSGTDSERDTDGGRGGRGGGGGLFGREKWRKRTDVVSEHATVIKILVSYLQVVSLVKNTPVEWPQALVNYFNVVSQASSAASGLAMMDCSMGEEGWPRAARIFLVTVLSPLYWGVAFCAFWLLRGLALRRRGQLLGGRALAGYVRRRSILTMNCVIFIQYPTVVNQLFSLFSCRLLDGGPPRPVCPDPWDGGTCVEDRAAVGLYWSQDLDQRCYRGLHLTLVLAVGIPGVLLFAVGMPLLSAWWLGRNRHRLDQPDFEALYGTLYEEYEKPYFFWESMVMLRKLAITAVIVFAGTYRWQLVLLLAIGVVALALVLQVTFRPYESDGMDELERLGLVATLTTYYLALYYLGDTVGPNVQLGLSIAILVVNSCVVVVMLVALARELHRAALFQLLHISSAAGDLPLSFVLRVGMSYATWRSRTWLLTWRVRLWAAAPAFCCCAQPAWPPGVRPEDYGLPSTAPTAPTANRQPSVDSGDASDAEKGWEDGQGQGQGQGKGSGARVGLLRRCGLGGRDPEEVARRAEALRTAWEVHYHMRWLARVRQLSLGVVRRMQAARAESGSGRGGREGARGPGSGTSTRSAWARALSSSVRTAAKSVMSMPRMVSKRASRRGPAPPPPHAPHPVDSTGAAAKASNAASSAGVAGSAPASAASVLSGPSNPYSPRYSHKYGQQLLHGALSPVASAPARGPASAFLPSPAAPAAMASTAASVTGSGPFASQTRPGSGPDPAATGAPADNNYSGCVPGDVAPGLAAGANSTGGGHGSPGGAASCAALTVAAASGGGGGMGAAVGRGSVQEGYLGAAVRALTAAPAAVGAHGGPGGAAEAAACGDGEVGSANGHVGGVAAVVCVEQVDVAPGLAAGHEGGEGARQGGL